VKEKIIKLAQKYLICFGIMALITVIMVISFGYSRDDSLATKYTILSDSFFVPGAVALMVGLLIWVSTTGFFDAIAYGATVFIKGFTKFKRTERFERFYEYKERKAEGRGFKHGYLLICGLVYLLIGAIFTMLFSNAL
jgi:hypothetical protein